MPSELKSFKGWQQAMCAQSGFSDTRNDGGAWIFHLQKLKNKMNGPNIAKSKKGAISMLASELLKEITERVDRKFKNIKTSRKSLQRSIDVEMI